MIAAYLTSKLAGPIAAGIAALLLAALIFQTVRIDGFPFYGPGLRGQLAECRTVNDKANDLAREAADRSREEGRASAALDAQALIAAEIDRRRETDKVLADLRVSVSKLRPIPPPPIVLPGELPVVVTPPALPVVCRMDQGALDLIRDTLNVQRGAPR